MLSEITRNRMTNITCYNLREESKKVKVKAECCLGLEEVGRGDRKLLVKGYKVLIKARMRPRNLLYPIRPVVNNIALYNLKNC